MSVAGVSIKTLVLLVVLVAGGAWGWASAAKPVGVDLGSGYANTTVTIPGGFWLASFGAFLLGIFIVVNRGAPRCSACSTPCARASASVRSRRCSTRRPRASSAPRSCRRCACSSSPLLLYVTRIIKPTQKLAFAVIAGMGGLALLYFFVFILSIFNWGWLYSDSFRIGRHRRHAHRDRARRAQPGARLRHDRGGVCRRARRRSSSGTSRFGLMVTLVWLYISILKLLALLSRNR